MSESKLSDKLSRPTIYDCGRRPGARPRMRTQRDGTVVEEKLPTQAYEKWVSKVGNVHPIVLSNGSRNRRIVDTRYANLMRLEHRRAGALPYFLCPLSDPQSDLEPGIFPKELRNPCRKGTYGAKRDKPCAHVAHLIKTRQSAYNEKCAKEEAKRETVESKRLKLERERMAQQDERDRKQTELLIEVLQQLARQNGVAPSPPPAE